MRMRLPACRRFVAIGLTVAVACVGSVLCGSPVAAQGPARGQTANADPISRSVRDAWQDVRRNVQESAEQMPEQDYAFKPVDQVRTFGQILAHLAGANYVFCSAARGEKTPFAEDHFEKTATTKNAIVKALNDSLGYCDTAYAALTDRTAGESIAMPFGMPASPRTSALLGNTGHNQEHYGNLVTYFRIKGMVPPSSKR